MFQQKKLTYTVQYQNKEASEWISLSDGNFQQYSNAVTRAFQESYKYPQCAIRILEHREEVPLVIPASR